MADSSNATNNSTPDAVVNQPAPQIVYVQQSSNQPAAPTEGLLQPKEGEQVFYIVRGQKVDPDGNPLK
jgi:hypothetical protein